MRKLPVQIVLCLLWTLCNARHVHNSDRGYNGHSHIVGHVHQHQVNHCSLLGKTMKKENIRYSNGKCFYFANDVKKTFRGAQEFCHNLGSSLIQISSKSMSDYVYEVLHKHFESTHYFWVGNNHHSSRGSQYCSMMSGKSHKYRDVRCNDGSMKLRFICEYEANQKSANTASQMSHVSQGVTVSDCPQNLRKDTHLKVFGQSCFLFEESAKRKGVDAKKDCESLGGTLAMVKSSAIEKFIRDEISHSRLYYWIGLQLDDQILDYDFDGNDRDESKRSSEKSKKSGEKSQKSGRKGGGKGGGKSGGKSGEKGRKSRDRSHRSHHRNHKKAPKYLYKWQDGTPMSYKNFASHRHTQNTKKKCATISGHSGKWHPRSCDHYKEAYICEFPIKPKSQPMTILPTDTTTEMTMTTRHATPTPTSVTKTATTPSLPQTSAEPTLRPKITYSTPQMSTNPPMTTTTTTTTSQQPATTKVTIKSTRKIMHLSAIEPTPKIISIVSFD